MKFFDIDYDIDVGEWFAYDIRGQVICWHASREDCFEEAIKEGYTLI